VVVEAEGSLVVAVSLVGMQLLVRALKGESALFAVVVLGKGLLLDFLLQLLLLVLAFLLGSAPWGHVHFYRVVLRPGGPQLFELQAAHFASYLASLYSPLILNVVAA